MPTMGRMCTIAKRHSSRLFSAALILICVFNFKKHIRDLVRFIRYELLFYMHKYKFKVIIYDGRASNARIFESAIDKSINLNQVIGSFRRLMAEHDTAVLITNQITDIPSEVELIRKSALGLLLYNNVNTKICFLLNQLFVSFCDGKQIGRTQVCEIATVKTSII